MSADEIWRPVVGCEGQYEVSSLGRVRSLDRIGTQWSNKAHRPMSVRLKGRILKPGTATGGYQTVKVRRGVSTSVHTLVLEAFVGPRPEGMECAHEDGNPANNCASNLRWATKVENQEDRRRHGTLPIGKGNWQGKKTHCKRGHEFTEETTRRVGDGRWRACKACERENARDPKLKAIKSAQKRKRYADPAYRAWWLERQREYSRRKRLARAAKKLDAA